MGENLNLILKLGVGTPYYLIFFLYISSRLARYAKEEKGNGKGKIETWNGSPGMVQGYPQSTLLAVAASRAKDKGGPTLSSVPTLRYLLYMPFRDTIRSACGSNGSHVSCVHVYPSHNETLSLPPLPPRLFSLPSLESFSFDGNALRPRIPG